MRLRELLAGNIMERALIEVFYSTGIRLNELVTMKKEDINWEERSIQIPDGKGDQGRIVFFNVTCEEYLKAYLDSRTDNESNVFLHLTSDKPIYGELINSLFQSYSKQLQFHVTPHMLRHTFTAHLAQKNAPLELIQTLLGHVTPYTALTYSRLYDHARKEKYDEWRD